jgi:hypothetical protein
LIACVEDETWSGERRERENVGKGERDGPTAEALRPVKRESTRGGRTWGRWETASARRNICEKSLG